MKPLSPYRHQQKPQPFLVWAVVFAFAPLLATGQVCPPNLDAEFGNFTNWQYYTGTLAAVSSTNVISVSPSGPIAGQHLVYSNQTARGERQQAAIF